jgi:hypothetical protein
MPTEMTYSVLLSNTNYLGVLSGLNIPELNELNSQSIAQRFSQLQYWLGSKKFPLTLITDEEQIQNLLLKSMHESRSPDDGNGKILEITFRQITVVSSVAAANGINYQGYQPLKQVQTTGGMDTGLFG